MTQSSSVPNPGNLASVPPDERTVLVVMPDESEKAESGTGGAVVLGILGAVVAGPLGAAIGAGLAVAASMPGNERGILRARRADAASYFMFQPGHPQVGQSYARHPLVDRAYIPLADFHRYLRESKHAELVRLLVSLGATRVRATMAQETQREQAGGLDVKLPGFELRPSFTRSDNAKHKIVFDEKYRFRGSPSVPDNLVWYPHEPTWQGLAKRRIEHGTSEATARLEYVDDFGVDGALAVRVQKAGGKLLGQFALLERVIWDFHVTFMNEDETKKRWKLW